MTPARQAKEVLFELVAQLAQAIANLHRLELLDLLVQAPRTVEQLAEASILSIANASQHLQRLKRAGLVTSERRAPPFATSSPTQPWRDCGSNCAPSPRSSSPVWTVPSMPIGK